MTGCDQFPESADNRTSMKSSSQPPDRDLRIRSAAFRLKHDLGKAIRWNAPAVRESDTEALRSRLKRDLLETRSTPSGVRNAVEVFDAWSREESRYLSGPEYETELDALRMAIDGMSPALEQLETLDAKGLKALDDVSAAVADRCRTLHRLALHATEDESE